jgi:hypothetical protein
MLQYNTSLVLQNSFHDVDDPWMNGKNQGAELASFWNSGFGPAIDASGNVFAISGNGFTNPSELSFADSVLKLSPTLSDPPAASFTPSNYVTLNKLDVDFGSGGVMLLPTSDISPARAVAMGKDPIIYLLDQGLGANAVTASYRLAPTSQNGVWGGPAYYNGADGPEIYYQTNDDVLRSFGVTASSVSPIATGTTKAGYGGSLPVVTSNGSTAGTALVWVLRRSTPVDLEAYDAIALGAPVYSASVGNHYGFLTPLVANGRVYVGGAGVITVLGLAQ